MKIFNIFLMVLSFHWCYSQQTGIGGEFGISRDFVKIFGSTNGKADQLSCITHAGPYFSILLKAKTLRSNYVYFKYSLQVPATATLESKESETTLMTYTLPVKHSFGIGYDIPVFRQKNNKNLLFLTSNFGFGFFRHIEVAIGQSSDLTLKKIIQLNPYELCLKEGLKYMIKREKIDFSFYAFYSIGFLYSNIIVFDYEGENFFLKTKGDAMSVGFTIVKKFTK